MMLIKRNIDNIIKNIKPSETSKGTFLYKNYIVIIIRDNSITVDRYFIKDYLILNKNMERNIDYHNFILFILKKYLNIDVTDYRFSISLLSGIR